MKQHILIMVLALAMGGCATLAKPGGVFYRSGQEKKLAGAVALLEQGKTSAAAERLAALVAEPGVAGVTDEALFRLGLLRLVAGQERNGTSQALRDLARLKKEYPASSWAPLAANLTEFLGSADDARQQSRKLKELNLSLARENKDLAKENKELRQRIEDLKALELELGGAKP